MGNLTQRGTKKPTTSRSKIVASWSKKSRFLRRSLAGLLRFIRRKRLWPEVEGDLSSWIFVMHGFKGERHGNGSLEPRYDPAVAADAARFLTQLLGPGMDVRKIEISMAQSQAITDDKVRKMIEAHRSGNRDAFQSVFSQAGLELMDAWGFPPSFSHAVGLSFDQAIRLIRATRATLILVAHHNEHPLVLITRASKGDRRAVLDLVRTDSLFVHDQCCIGTIRRAELQDDHRFLAQLQRAMGHRAKLHRRNVLHVYYYIFALFELWGVSLPTLEELWNTLDPLGREYDSLSAFERDFQRRRQVFNRMLAVAEAEVPVQVPHPIDLSDSFTKN